MLKINSKIANFNEWLFHILAAIAIVYTMSMAIIGICMVTGNYTKGEVTVWDVDCNGKGHRLLYKVGNSDFYTITKDGEKEGITCGNTNVSIRRITE